MLAPCKAIGLTLAVPAVYRSSNASQLHRVRPVSSALPGYSLIADVMIQTAPTNAAAAQNTMQNLVAGTPETVKELPEKLIIAVSLTAVAVVGYLLRDKLQKDK
ncbi:hypothetical protein COCOBI_09-4750 [Coccomyxa sp. Obi]|nr:hypothetical protein COCOBI_09-4750 [Coccomyxa sp. Obi]